MDLGGTWRAAPANEELRRTFHATDYDDSDWISIKVPGHWAEIPELAGTETVLYRHSFNGPDPHSHSQSTHCTQPTPEPTTDARWWIRFEGLAQQGDVWLDDIYLGNTDGYFVPHEMEVSEQITERSEHVLAVEASCPRFGDSDNRFTLTGALQDPELAGSSDLIIGGLWRPVLLRSTRQIAIKHVRVICTDIRTQRGSTPTKAKLALRAVLDVPDATTVNLRTRVAGTEHVYDHPAATGENRVEWTIDINDPELWWPHALGDQSLYDLTIEALANNEIHDSRHFRIGFRKISVRKLIFSINGERIHLKGANLLPTRSLLGAAHPKEVSDDIKKSREIGLDLIRPVAHIARPELYETADELGMLIWQDLPIRGVMNRSVNLQACRQAREAADLLSHHPSVAIWCAHDEPFARSKSRAPLSSAVSWRKPSWNRDVLDSKLCHVLNRCDGSRPVIAHTGAPPHWYSPRRNTTSNIWLNREQGTDLATTSTWLSKKGRFLSSLDALGSPETIKNAVETLRRIKYRPNGGFLLSCLDDLSRLPNTIRVFDSPDIKKALIKACKPLTVMAHPLPKFAHPETRIVFDVHVINDRRQKIKKLKVRARILDTTTPTTQPLSEKLKTRERILDTAQQHTATKTRERILDTASVIIERGWAGSVKADKSVRVGKIKFRVPAGKSTLQNRKLTPHRTPHEPGNELLVLKNPVQRGSRSLIVELEVRVAGTLVNTNRYNILIQ